MLDVKYYRTAADPANRRIDMSSLINFSTPAEQAVEETFRRLAEATDVFERYAHPHASRIAELTDALAQRFKLPGHDRRSLRIAALAHDLGEAKMERDYIQLQLPARLSTDEQMDLARHPVIGEQEAARNGADKASQLLVRWHHEWWNGDGYPDGLRREQIPLAARILRVCDAFAALTDDRPYRPALTVAEARRHLTEWAGLEFDPHIVKMLLELDDPRLIHSYADRVVPDPAEAPYRDPDPALIPDLPVSVEQPLAVSWETSPAPVSPSEPLPVQPAAPVPMVPASLAQPVNEPVSQPATEAAEQDPTRGSMFSDF
jgi:response regulator RpfG family c-di-GMP phosphodiesterase